MCDKCVLQMLYTFISYCVVYHLDLCVMHPYVYVVVYHLSKELFFIMTYFD